MIGYREYNVMHPKPYRHARRHVRRAWHLLRYMWWIFTQRQAERIRCGDIPWYVNVTSGLVLMFGPILVMYPMFKLIDYHILSLSPSATVAEYHAASVRRQMAFTREICESASCWPDSQSDCGFASVDDPDLIAERFHQIIDRVADDVTLAEVVDYCARPSLEYYPPADTPDKREKCLQRGGTWGVRGPAPTLRLKAR